MNIDFSFWLMVLMTSSGIIAAVDKLGFEPDRLAPVKGQLLTMKKKERRNFIQKSRELKAPLLADCARSSFGSSCGSSSSGSSPSPAPVDRQMYNTSVIMHWICTGMQLCSKVKCKREKVQWLMTDDNENPNEI